MSYSFKKDDYPSKMIDFVKAIYKRFKVLNKLSEKESNDFQKEVVTLLVDSNENVDQEIYNNIISDIGLEAFVLETLGNVIQRNPFKNQFELNRNLSTIADTLKKDQQELQKRQKVLQRKQQKLKATEEQIITSVKQKILSFQSESIQKILKKQAQVKKSLTLLLNQIKTKQKVILQKSEAIKSNAKIISQIDQKEKALVQRIKTIEKRQKELKGKDNEVSMMKKESQIQEVKETNEKLRENIKELNKRYKNLELAYKKMKTDAQKWQTRKQNEIQPQSDVKKCQPIPQINLRPNRLIEIDDLELSTIEPPHKAETCEQMLNHINHEEISIKFERVKRIIQQLFKSNKLSLNPAQTKQLKSLLNIDDDSYPNALSSQEQDSIEQSIHLQCLIQKQQPTNDHESLLKQIRQIQVESDEDKLNLIDGDGLTNLTERCMKINFPYQICEAIFELMIELIEQGQYYDHVIDHLGSPKIIAFLQQTYLNHETNSDIIETATLLISRIKLHDPEIKLSPSFLRALQIRLKMQSKNSFVYGNINSILH